MDLDDQAETLAQKIRHLIITASGKTAAEAPIHNFYHAFCTALREEVMINWIATNATFEKKRTKMLFFLSMEYLPGRYLNNNLSNIRAQELTDRVLAKLGRNRQDLIACESDPALGNGGLGRLASCLLDSLASLRYPARAYGLRYQYGIFEQEVWDGRQVERPDCWLLTGDPWEMRRDEEAVSVRFDGKVRMAQNFHGDPIHLLESDDEVRAVPYDTPIIGYALDPNYAVLNLRLWSTKESPRNFQLQRYNAGFLDQATENTSLTDVLYPSDNHEMGKRVRLKQEFLLVSASLQDLLRRHLHVFGDMTTLRDYARIQINDTHAALVVAELIRTLMKNHNFAWKDAVETCREVCSYTNHTILREALEEWNEKRLAALLPRQHWIIQQLNHEFCEEVRRRFPGDEERVRRMSILENGQARMAHLAIVGSHRVNGVAKLHGEILKKDVFADFHAMSPRQFTYVTNGVAHRRWLVAVNPPLSRFLVERIGEGWITDFSQIQEIAPFAQDPEAQAAFFEIKQGHKERLARFLERENPVRDRKGALLRHPPPLPPTALYDVQIKRIHEYKRQLLNALHLVMLYHEWKEGKERLPRMAIFGGKAAPGYVRAKEVILLLSAIGRKLTREEHCGGRLGAVFIENYNVSKAEVIIPAADLSEQISAAGWEASGTGNMKLTMNGALTIGTEDGANIEMRESIGDKWWPFRFGATAAENRVEFRAQEVYHRDEAIRRAVDTLRDGTFAETAEERASFAELYRSLVESDRGHSPDRYRVLKDLRPYYDTQKRVEELYQDRLRWSECALHNIAGMGPFSTDRTAEAYAREIWGIAPTPPDPEIVKQVREEYAAHDRCRIQSSPAPQ